jgi:dynactin complex subunit
LYVGLELLDYSEGLTSGEFDGVRYFRCDTGAMQNTFLIGDI